MALSSDTWGCGGVSGAAQKQKCHFERELFQPQWSEVRLNTPLLSRLFAPFASFYGCAKFLKSSHELFGGNGPFCERGTSPGSTFATALESCAISEFETVVKQIREERRRRGEEERRCEVQKFAPPSHTFANAAATDRQRRPPNAIGAAGSREEEQFSKASILAQKPTARTRDSGRDRLKRPGNNELQRKNRQ